MSIDKNFMHKVLCMNEKNSKIVCLVLENQKEMWYNGIKYTQRGVNTMSTLTEKEQKEVTTTMIFTCDACNYTFSADTLPTSCPDCGKSSVDHRIGNKFISAPAVRNATADEIAWYDEIQAEIAAEEAQKEYTAEMDKMALTDEEYNWSLVMLFSHKTPRTEEARKLTASQLKLILKDPQRTLDYYISVRKTFTQAINADRAALKDEEPIGVYRMNEYGEMVLNDGLDEYGPALSVLYHFRIEDKLLHTPSLGDLRRIDLKRIAEEPSTAYKQIMLDMIRRLGG